MFEIYKCGAAGVFVHKILFQHILRIDWCSLDTYIFIVDILTEMRGSRALLMVKRSLFFRIPNQFRIHHCLSAIVY